MLSRFPNLFNKRIFFTLFLIALLVILDQAAKLWATNTLNGQEDIILWRNVLQLHYLRNTGAAFSLLRNATWVLTLLTAVICLVLIAIFVKIPNERKYLPLNLDIAFLIAGALGNLIDRFTNNYVVDFIYFSLIDFPVFNVADIYVTVSIAVLILLVLFYYKEDDFSFLTLSVTK